MSTNFNSYSYTSTLKFNLITISITESFEFVPEKKRKQEASTLDFFVETLKFQQKQLETTERQAQAMENIAHELLLMRTAFCMSFGVQIQENNELPCNESWMYI